MKKILIVLIVLMATTLLLTCQEDVLRIAFIGDLSSKNSQLAVDARNALIICVEMDNERGGINGHLIELVPMDNKSDPTTALEVHDQLKKDGIKFVIGHLKSNMASVTIESADDSLLFVSPSMSTDKLSKLDDYVLRTSPINSNQAIIISDYFKKYAIVDLVVIKDNSNAEYTTSLLNALKDLFLKDEINIDLIEYDTRTDELSNVAKEVVEKDADNYLFLSQATDTAHFAQKLAVEGVKSNMFSVSWSMTGDLIEKGGSSVEGMIFVGINIPSDSTQRADEFTKRFEEKFNYSPSFIASLTYDAYMALKMGIENANALTPSEVKKTILDIGMVEGLNEVIQLDKYGDNDRAYLLYRLEEGSFNPLRDW
jgi:branched-chain amino acid transport system substrate-binding protein